MENINDLEAEEKIEDWYIEMKVYNNGDHYIGIPHTKRKVKDGFAKPSARMEYTVEREDYECKRIIFFGRKSDKF